jgi:hypothetical protein
MEFGRAAPMYRLVAAAALAVVSISAHLSGAQIERPVAAERVEAFQWFSSLGFPDVKDAKFVRFPAGDDRHGFLLGETKEAWTVLGLRLDTKTIEKKSDSSQTSAAGRACIPEDFARFVEAASHDPGNHRGLLDPEFDYDTPIASRRFVIAWMCWRRGLERPAAEWFDRAAQSIKPTPGKSSQVPKLWQQVAAEFARKELTRTEIDLQDPDVSRDTVLERLIRLDGKYPGVAAANRAQTMALALKKMVREDREHAQQEKENKPFAQRTREAQIAELIFQLRDQGGQCWSLHNSVDIFAGSRWRRGEGPNPANQLVKIGYDAVPQLIEALANDRPSRALDVRSRLVMSTEESPYYLLTVGDCALRILERLSQQSFFERRDEYMSESPARIAAVREKAEAWNRTLQHDLKLKGEKGVLAEAIQKGDWKSIPLAERLVEQFPESSLRALATAAGNSQDSFTQSRFVELMGHVPGERTVPLLLDELRKSRSLYVRVEIAWTLLTRGRPEAVAAMLDEWKGSATKASLDPSLIEVAFFLGACRKLEAVRALAANLDKRPPEVRLAVAAAFARRENMGGSGSSRQFSHILFHRRFFSASEPPVVTRSDTALVGPVVDLLVSELDDTESLGGLEGTWDDKNFANLCVGDVAARALNQLDAQRFPFDISADPLNRDRSRAEIRNAWRKQHGFPTVPLPQIRTVVLIPAAIVTPLLDRLQSSRGAQRAAAESEIEKLGPGAVPEVLARHDALNVADPFRAALNRLGRRLAHIVTEVQIADGSLKPNAKMAVRLERLKGRPLDSASFQKFVFGLSDDLAKPSRGFRILLLRSSAASGVTLRLDLLDKPHADAAADGSTWTPLDVPKDRPYGWQSSMRGRAGDTSLFGVEGAGQTFDAWSLQMLADEAFRADLCRRLEVNIELIGRWRD